MQYDGDCCSKETAREGMLMERVKFQAEERTLALRDLNRCDIFCLEGALRDLPPKLNRCDAVFGLFEGQCLSPPDFQFRIYYKCYKNKSPFQAATPQKQSSKSSEQGWVKTKFICSVEMHPFNLSQGWMNNEK